MNNPDGDPFKMFPPLQKVQNGMGYVGSEEGISHRKKRMPWLISTILKGDRPYLQK